ncbi:COG2833: uncharacterized protein [hydrothermal vent metagenome]|uniref:COG2833: uncharacterized protein n=1 Tax=hydrothermal vent metagenome TaxID=652676 RepID=A0A1W1BPK6_9ZZZZ
MNIQEALKSAIISDDIKIKKTLINDVLYHIKADSNIIQDNKIETFNEPSYSSFCTIVNPRDLPSRKDFDTNEGLATLVHSVTHIEYSAIDLALDAVYRYPFMPIDYKIDWIEVAIDEMRHFEMLNELLNDLGYSYGDFPVHCGLFDASFHTRDNIIDRMAIIPRYYEASGLDVNPQIIKKLENRHKNPNIKRLMNMLKTIYDEEIIHVQKGDKWFKYLCDKDELDVELKYIEILTKYKLITKHRPHINVDARKEAGFSCNELMKLGAKKCDD